jgi:TrmH RNA methyltransferase
VHGLRAGLALIAKRPNDVVRIAFSRASARLVEPATRALKSRGVPCRILSDLELDRLARVEQHEGLVIEAKPRAWIAPDALEAKTRTIVALDRVRNPYNIGAIIRSAAFFGVDALLVGAPPDHPGLDAQAVRVAEGGAEHLVLARTTHLGDALGALRKKGAMVLGADGHAKTAIGDVAIARPVVLVFGNEREGLHDRVRAQCDHLVAVRGSGRVESLNVAVAAGILIAALG